MKIKIPNNWFYELLFILSIGVTYLDHFELTLGVWSFSFVVSIARNYSISLLKLLVPYILILLLAVFVGLNYEHTTYFMIRDIA